MSDIIEVENKQVIQMLYYYKKLSGDLQPIFNDFEKYYQKKIGDNWDMKGTPYGLKWEGLTPNYKAYKKKRLGHASADLILTGALKTAATGGAGWISNKTGTSFEFGVDIPYAKDHQYGLPLNNLPQRPFFLMNDNKNLPGEATNYLINAVTKAYNEIKDKI